MAPRKIKSDAEEKAKPMTTASLRVTRSMARRTRSSTGSATKFAKIESPQKKKKKLAPVKKGRKKEKGEEEEETKDVEEISAEKKVKKEKTVEEVGAADESTRKTIVIEHCKQCNSFKTRAIQVKEGLEEGVPGISVVVNPEKPRRGCFEIREEDGETFISLLDMKRPFSPMKVLDMKEVIADIIKKIKRGNASECI